MLCDEIAYQLLQLIAKVPICLYTSPLDSVYTGYILESKYKQHNMQTAIINIKADPKLKKEAQRVAGNLGLPLGTVINNYLTQFVQEKSVTFRMPYTLNKKTAKEVREAISDFKAGKNISPAFTTTKEMDAYLDSL